MVDEGWKYYDSISRDYGIDPGIERSGCMIDLLGQTGNLASAKIFIDEMSLLSTARIWGSLLIASRNNKNMEFAELAAEHILSLEHDNTGCYVLLANMCAETGGPLLLEIETVAELSIDLKLEFFTSSFFLNKVKYFVNGSFFLWLFPPMRFETTKNPLVSIFLKP